MRKRSPFELHPDRIDPAPAACQPVALGDWALESSPDHLVQAWLQLARRLGANPTLRPEWTRVAAKVLGEHTEPRLFAVEQSGALKGAVPYRCTRIRRIGVPFTTVEPLSNLMSYHAELLADEPGDVLEALLRHVGEWDIFRMVNVHEGSRTEQALRDVASVHGYGIVRLAGDESPHLPIDRTWNEFLATRDKKFRYKYRKRQASLSSGELSLQRVQTVDQVERLIDAMLSIESRSWKAAYGYDLASKSSELAYYRVLLPELALRGELAAFLLFERDTAIAFSLCWHADGWVGQMKTSFDERYGQHSPGAIVVDASVQFAFDVGAREFDFLGHTDRHKSAWTKSTRKHHDYFIFSHRLRAKALRLAGTLKRRLVGYRRVDPVKPADG